MRLQQWFLWGGGLGQKKIAWVKWDSVCLPKEKEGLGNRDLRKFNYALLGKRRWNLFHHQGELWARVLDSKYKRWRNLDEERRVKSESFWWQEISFITHSTEDGSWFEKRIKWKMGCRAKVRFWEDGWRKDDVPLMLKYPRLYINSYQQEQFIQQMGSF